MDFNQLGKYIKFLIDECSRILDDYEVTDDELHSINNELIKIKNTVENDDTFSVAFVTLIHSLKIDVKAPSSNPIKSFVELITDNGIREVKRLDAVRELKDTLVQLLYLIREDKVFK